MVAMANAALTSSNNNGCTTGEAKCASKREVAAFVLEGQKKVACLSLLPPPIGSCSPKGKNLSVSVAEVASKKRGSFLGALKSLLRSR